MPNEIMLEVAEVIKEMGGEALCKCYQCGTCTATCPWTDLTHYNMRKFLHMAQLGVEGIEDAVYQCSTCGHCVERCPRGMESINLVQAVRRVFGEGGMLPAPLRTMTGSLQAQGNPWSGERDERTQWAEGLDLPPYEAQEFLWFNCCTTAYDPRNKSVGIAQAKLLKAAGADFGVFGNEMECCGESAGKVEGGELTDKLMTTNTGLFKDKNVKRVLVSSPHCLDTFKKDYEVEVEPLHLLELFAAKITDGTFKPTKDLGGIKVTYHDPCYLGRHNEVYDAPRKILEAIPGVEFVEMPRNGVDSFCCGGGGGGMWMEREKGERPSDFRMEEARDTGASVLATACPYCILMFEDSMKNLDLEGKMKIVEVSELLAESMEL
jgi:Fe-S oxidoreductase